MTDWLYYSTLVPGYTETYGRRGMRERNQLLLAMAAKGRSEEELRPVADLLADNNRPLAMFIAHRYGTKRDWDTERIMDAYQHSCVVLVNSTRKYLATQQINQAFYQRYIFVRMLESLDTQQKLKTFENASITTIPYNDDEYVNDEEKKYSINVPLIMTMLGDRECEMLFDFYGIERPQLDIRAIAEKWGLSQGRVGQIIIKAREKLQKTVTRLRSQKRISIDAFLLEPWERPKWEKQETTNETSRFRNTALPKIFQDTNNEKLKH